MSKAIEELELKLVELEKAIKDLKEQERKEVRKHPKIGDVCYLLLSDGKIYESEWEDIAEDYDYWNCRSMFFTQEDAEFEREKRKVIREMEGFSRDFKFSNDNYYLSYSYSDFSIEINKYRLNQLEGLCFESKEKIDEMFKAVGRDRVKKYYLGVDDE